MFMLIVTIEVTNKIRCEIDSYIEYLAPDEGHCIFEVSGPPEAQLINVLSKFHCLLHKLYLTNHSSQERATYGTSCLLLAFLNLTTCHL